MYNDRRVPKQTPKRAEASRCTRTGGGLPAAVCTAFFILFLVAFLAGPMPASADPGPAPGDQDRASVARGSSGSSSGGSSGSQGRTSVSRGSGGGGGAARTRPGGGGGSGGRTTVNRPPRSGSGHRAGYFPRHFHGYYPYFGFSYFRYPYYLGFRHYPFGSYGYPGVVWYDYQAYGSMGGIDLNVRPKKAQVYVDGQRIGRVGRFDGYPSALWLEEGTYELVIYHPGYRTLHETVKVFSGVVIDFDYQMVPGEATPPEELVPPPTVPPEQVAEGEASGSRAGPEDVPRREMDLRHEPARLYLTVEPRDASVYLDGRFLGTGDELADLRSGLMVNPGEHQLSVVRPTFESEELTVDVAAGEDLELAVRLRRTDGAR